MKSIFRTIIWLIGMAVICSSNIIASCPPVYTMTGETSYDSLGFKARYAGDLNQDGHDDFMISSQQAGDINHGLVWVYSGLDGDTLYVLSGENDQDKFGFTISTIEDLNADNVPDIVVGAPSNDEIGLSTGKVYIFSGQDGSQLGSISGYTVGENFGASVSGIGDLNGDNVPDIIVGSANRLGGGYGFVSIVSGQTFTPIDTVFGEEANDWFGAYVASIEDLDDDNIPDFIVGAPFFDGSGFNIGKAYVYSGLDRSLIHTFTGGIDDGRLGWSVAGVGKIDLDDYPDIAVGALYDDNAGYRAGAVYIYSGSDGSLLRSYFGKAAGDNLGATVGNIGDINDDDVPDIFVGAMQHTYNGTGWLEIYSGLDNTLLFEFQGETNGDNFGFDASGADVDNDGIYDLVVGAFGHSSGGIETGRAYVFLLGDNDSDGITNDCDNCPDDSNEDQVDTDEDGIGDICDNCPDHYNPGQEDGNDNGIGDACDWICGDGNDDVVVNILDITFLINYLYKEGPAPNWPEACDVNSDGSTNILDITYLVNFLYKSGPEPVCMGPGKLSLISYNGSINCSLVNGRSRIEISSPIDLCGIELRLITKETDNIRINNLVNDLNVYHSQKNDEVKIGMLDVSGQHFVEMGNTGILEFDGEIDITHALGSGRNAEQVSFKLIDKIIPMDFELYQNHPNPFNPLTKIDFNLPVAGDVSLTVYDIRGRNVVTLVEKHLEAGAHNVDFDASYLSSGVYFYRLQAREFHETKKMTLLK